MTPRRRILLVLTLAAASSPAVTQEQPRAEGADSVCIPTGRGLAMGVTRVDSATGDSVVVTAEGEVSWRTLARQHAEGRPWLLRGEPVEGVRTVRVYKGKKVAWVERPELFYPVHRPVRLQPGDSVVYAGVEADGVPFYVERGFLGEIQYLPLRPGCWFQAYQAANIVEVVDARTGQWMRENFAYPMPARAPLRRTP